MEKLFKLEVYRAENGKSLVKLTNYETGEIFAPPLFHLIFQTESGDAKFCEIAKIGETEISDIPQVSRRKLSEGYKSESLMGFETAMLQTESDDDE